MADNKEQVKPLAPLVLARPDEAFVHDDFSWPDLDSSSRKRQKCIKCCGCSAAVILILVMILLALMLTLLRIKDPKIRVNFVKIEGLDTLNGSKTNVNGTSIKLTLVENVSVKNPNVAAFKFDDTKTSVYCNESVVGEESSPAGEILAGKTLGMNVSVEVMANEFDDGDSGNDILSLRTNTRMEGKVKIRNIVRRSVVVKMECTIRVNTRTQVVQDWDCTKKISL